MIASCAEGSASALSYGLTWFQLLDLRNSRLPFLPWRLFIFLGTVWKDNLLPAPPALGIPGDGALPALCSPVLGPRMAARSAVLCEPCTHCTLTAALCSAAQQVPLCRSVTAKWVGLWLSLCHIPNNHAPPAGISVKRLHYFAFLKQYLSIINCGAEERMSLEVALSSRLRRSVGRWRRKKLLGL